MPLTVALVAALLALAITPAAAEDIGRLMAHASQRGTVRVIARLDVPSSARALAGDPDPNARLTAIRGARAALARDLGSTAWAATHEYDTIPYVALEVTPEALTALTLSGAVLDVEEDRLEKVLLPQSVPLIQADAAWAEGFDGSEWVVAVLDTGVDSGQPFLAGKVVDQACYSGNSSCPNGRREQIGPGAGEPCGYASNACGHGTHVAGIAAGTGDEFSGVARGASLISIQVFSRFDGADCDDDIEDPCAKSYTSDTIAALERVYQLRDTYKIAAVNMSLGAGSYNSQPFCDQQDAARKAAIDNLRSVGIATVAASGNEGEPNSLSAPGCISSAISVGAVSKTDGVALFSNSSSFLTLLAPGVSILSSVPGGFGTLSGTSEAAPHVAGAFAILSQKLGRNDIDTVLGALQQTGVQVQDPRNGLLKPRISVRAALNALPAPRPASGLQVTPDGARTLISKDVGAERWAITANPEDGTVTGNVFSPSGGPPQFVYCTRTGDDGDPDPSTVEIFFSCSGANACESSVCPGAAWNFIADVSLPGSFFQPPRASGVASTSGVAGTSDVAGETTAPGGVAGGSRPSGLQITPDLERTLISKDVGAERWAITLNPDDTVTGNVFSSSGGEPQFVWCQRTGDDGNPDPSAVQIDFACSGANSCPSGPCTPEQWTFIGNVTLPGSFFRP